ncbi:hypothetical protein [Anabaena sp. PCC 7108]|uniref:hypothetical protein n=1 Tax=Anabaena sp. PCC 7108 TaxID=163908 RepID=UPI000345F7F6|nr:hypothetical protein [Anabaena sp. PCC 7108]
MKEASIWDSVAYYEARKNLPQGFSAFKCQTGKSWDIYFKLTESSTPETIQRNLTEKKAKAKAKLLNSVLETK